ncbi:MAG: hypothetical protein FWF53_05710 [Candidatus Azobacteroides sp.]|nr:hypothetical protein [Candidatus Azobacteroides sp.]
MKKIIFAALLAVWFVGCGKKTVSDADKVNTVDITPTNTVEKKQDDFKFKDDLSCTIWEDRKNGYRLCFLNKQEVVLEFGMINKIYQKYEYHHPLITFIPEKAGNSLGIISETHYGAYETYEITIDREYVYTFVMQDTIYANWLKKTNTNQEKTNQLDNNVKISETTKTKTSKEELLEYIESFSYVKKAVIADNGGLIIAVIPGEKSPEMLAKTFLNQANNSKVNVRYCKIVSAIGATLNGDYINGKKLALVNN